MAKVQRIDRKTLMTWKIKLDALMMFHQSSMPNLCTEEGAALLASFEDRQNAAAEHLRVLDKALGSKNDKTIQRLTDSHLFLLHLKLASQLSKVSPLNAYQLIERALTTLRPEHASFKSRDQALKRLSVYAKAHDRLHWKSKLVREAYKTQLHLFKEYRIPFNQAVYDEAFKAIAPKKDKAETKHTSKLALLSKS